jgi:hypothetical protein
LPVTSASVVVVVMSWNARDLTLRCLDSLARQTCGGRPIDVELGTNTGFAAGANAGMLNNDATADPDFVENLTDPLLRPETAGESRLGATTGRVRLRGGFARAGSDAQAALRRRRQIDRTACVLRSVPAHLLVADAARTGS